MCISLFTPACFCRRRPISFAIETVCECGFLPLSSSLWHWKRTESSRCCGQMEDQNNSSKDNLCRLSVSPLSVLHASSVSMATVSGCIFLFLHFSLRLALIVTQSFALRLERRRKRKGHFTRLPLALFYPASNTPFYGCVFVLISILERLYARLFYLLFVWHLVGVPQGEVHSVSVAEIKAYRELNHYKNR